MRKFNFIVRRPPDEETIKKLHDNLANIFIKKYGEKIMKEVLRMMESQEEKQ